MDLSWHQIDRQSDYRLLDYLGPFLSCLGDMMNGYIR